MPLPLALTLQASAPQTTNGQSAAFDLLGSTFATDGLSRRLATLLLEVTAVSGTTPTLDIVIETAPNTSSWQSVLSFNQLKTVGFQRLKFAPLERYVRARWTIGGTTPSFTLAISGLAEVIYSDFDDFYAFALPKAAVGTPDPPDLLASAILGASSDAAAWIPRHYATPLKEPYPASLRMRCSHLAGYRFLSQRGFDPDDPADKEVKDNHDRALGWFDDLGNGTVPDWIDATPDVTESGAAVVSLPKRGW